MSNVHEIFRTHPHPTNMDMTFLSTTAEELFACSQACSACADDCLGEDQIQTLRRCIRTCLDCADICETTGRLVSRQTESNGKLIQSQLDACVLACQICADECERHASMHEHCRFCAETCRHCEKACSDLRGKMAA